jgi:hypothetical protein
MADDLLTPKHLKWIFALVLMAGVTFYFMWGFAFHAFFDFANYTITVILVFTGLIGTFLYRELEREQAKAKASE